MRVNLSVKALKSSLLALKTVSSLCISPALEAYSLLRIPLWIAFRWWAGGRNRSNTDRGIPQLGLLGPGPDGADG